MQPLDTPSRSSAKWGEPIGTTISWTCDRNGKYVVARPDGSVVRDDRHDSVMVPVIDWVTERAVTSRDYEKASQGGRPDRAKKDAEDLLSGGPIPARDFLDSMLGKKHSERTAKRARTDAGGESLKVGSQWWNYDRTQMTADEAREQIEAQEQHDAA